MPLCPFLPLADEKKDFNSTLIESVQGFGIIFLFFLFVFTFVFLYITLYPILKFFYSFLQNSMMFYHYMVHGVDRYMIPIGSC